MGATLEATAIEPVLEERSRRIVETAVELAEEGGFEAVRLRDVAAHAGVALGTLYRRFRSKEDLLIAALALETYALEERFRQRPSRGETQVERVTAFFSLATRGMLRRPNLSRAMLRAAAAGEPALAKKVASFHESVQRMVVGALRGDPLAHGDPPPSERERLVADVLNQIWFALMVGWSGGLHGQSTMLERLRASIELVLDDSRPRTQ